MEREIVCKWIYVKGSKLDFKGQVFTLIWSISGHNDGQKGLTGWLKPTSCP